MLKHWIMLSVMISTSVEDRRCLTELLQFHIRLVDHDQSTNRTVKPKNARNGA